MRCIMFLLRPLRNRTSHCQTAAYKREFLLDRPFLRAENFVVFGPSLHFPDIHPTTGFAQ